MTGFVLEGTGLGEKSPTSAEILLENSGEAEVIDGVAVLTGDDGDVIVDFGGLPSAPANDMGWDSNLAETMDDATLDLLAGEMADALGDDEASRKQWLETWKRGIDQMGLVIENRDAVFKGACGARDPMVAEAAVRFQANFRGELLPAGGPVKTMIMGEETPERRDQAERVKTFMNYYLTQQDRGYYPDSDQMGMWLAIGGSVFKKIYQHPVTGYPVSRYITPDKFVVAYTTTDLATCQRMTHIEYQTKREVKWRQMTGAYRNIVLGEPSETTSHTPIDNKIDQAQGTTPIIPTKDDRYTICECHVDYDMPGYEHKDDNGVSGFPLPWIVVFERESRKVLAVRRNWREGDMTYTRKQHFVAYKYFPGLGVYGFGLTHLLGGYEQAATMILRELVDAGKFANFPGGIMDTNVRLENNNFIVGPGEFHKVDAGGRALRDVFQPLVYKEPSLALNEFRRDIVEGARRVASTTEIAVGDGRQDAPVGTTIALLEQAKMVESAVIKRCYASQAEEFSLLAAMFGEILPDSGYPFPVPGGEGVIMRQDFDDRIDVIPVGDPNIPSSAQRMLRAEAVMRIASTLPDVHDMREIARLQYEAWGIPRSQIDVILPPPSEARPMDPVTENQLAIKGGQLAVGAWQDDDAHIAVHMAFAEVSPALQAHIADHFGSKWRKAVQMALGVTLPPIGEPLPPEIENEIARRTAEQIQAIKDATGIPPGGQQDMLAVAIEDIKVKREKVMKDFEADMAGVKQKAMGEYLDYLGKTGDQQVKLSVARINAEAKKHSDEKRAQAAARKPKPSTSTARK